MPAWLSWIAAGLAWLIRTVLNRPPVAVTEAEKAGAAAQAAADAEAQARAEAAAAQAAVQAPDTADEVAERMAQGTF